MFTAGISGNIAGRKKGAINKTSIVPPIQIFKFGYGDTRAEE